MASVTLKGNPVQLVGELPSIGSKAPGTLGTTAALEDVSLDAFAGKALVLNIFPSIDTGVCAASVREFNQRAAGHDNVAVLCVSADLPFALKRFCGAEGIEGVSVISTFRSSLGDDYGVRMTSGPLAGLLARAVVVVNANGEVVYTELVPEIGQEPDYEKALASV